MGSDAVLDTTQHREISSLLDRAQALHQSSDYHATVDVCRDILARLPNTSHDEADWIRVEHYRAQSLCRLSHALCRLGNVSDALAEAAKALLIATNAGSTADMAAAHEATAKSNQESGRFNEAKEHYTLSHTLYDELKDTSGVGRTLNGLGIVYCDGISDYPKAIEAFENSLNIFTALDDSYWAAQNLGCLATVYQNLRLYDKSLEYITRYQQACEKTGSKSGISYSLWFIGRLHLNLGSPSTALEYFKKANAIDVEIGDKHNTLKSLADIGQAYMNLADYHTSLEYLSKSAALSEEIHDVRGSAVAVSSMGAAYLYLKEYGLAIEQFKKSLSLYDEGEMKVDRAYRIADIGEVYAIPDFGGYDPVLAEEYLLKGIGLAEDLGIQPFEYYKILADLYHHEGLWEKSDRALRTYIRAEKESLNTEVREKARQLEVQKMILDREREIAVAKAAADAQINATTTLLHKVLPQSVADRLMNGERIADYFPLVSILFADIVGFTPLASQMHALDVLNLLNYVFGEFDRTMEKHGCQKIKTMGDGYMAVCGAPVPVDDHAERLALAALDLLNDIELPETLRSSLPKGSVFHLRIGLHCGPAFAGIVGENGFVYDVYSNAVNIASRMESHGEPGRIHVSHDFCIHLQNRMDATGHDGGGIRFLERGEMDIKGKGKMKTYFLERA